MAVETLEKPKAKKSAAKTFPVQFGGYGVGKKTCSLSVSVSREDIAIEDADALLTMAQLNVTIKRDDPADSKDAKGQAKFIDNSPAVINGVADVMSLSVKGDAIGFRMAFNKDDAPKHDLEACAFCTAKLSLKRVGDAKPEPEKPSGDSDEKD